MNLPLHSERGPPREPRQKNRIGKERLLEGLLFDLRGLAHLIAQVVELGATNLTATGDLDLLDLGRVHRERALNTHREADLADRECLTGGFAMAADDITLKDLDPLAVALSDPVVNLYVVTRAEIRHVLLDVLGLYRAYDVHSYPRLSSIMLSIHSCVKTRFASIPLVSLQDKENLCEWQERSQINRSSP